MTAIFQEDYARILEAEHIINHFQANQYLRYTPLLESPFLNAIAGCRLLLKCDNLQMGGAFKARGAFYACYKLHQNHVTHVVAFSSGNHAWAVAMAAKYFNMRATIIMPHDAPALKKRQTEFFTDDIILFDRNTQSREQIGADIVAQYPNAALIPPYDNKYIIAGQGTLGREIIAQCEALHIIPDVITVPCGGGGLLAGTCLSIKNTPNDTWHNCAIYGVEPEEFNDTALSLAQGRRVRNAQLSGSICDALLSVTPGELTFPIVQHYSHGIITLNDDAIMQSVRMMLESDKILVEPGGAIAAAALLHHKITPTPAIAVAVLSGGNADITML